MTLVLLSGAEIQSVGGLLESSSIEGFNSPFSE